MDILENRDVWDSDQAFSRMSEVAERFHFGPRLGEATFPPAFVDTYKAYAPETVDWDGDKTWFKAEYPDTSRVTMFDGLETPYGMRMQNGIVSESAYARNGAMILPKGHYIIGRCYDEDECRLLIDLRAGQPGYGSLYVWRLAYDPLGEGDNTRPLGRAASSLEQFLGSLTAEENVPS